MRLGYTVAAVCLAEVLGMAGYSVFPALIPLFLETWKSRFRRIKPLLQRRDLGLLARIADITFQAGDLKNAGLDAGID